MESPPHQNPLSPGSFTVHQLWLQELAEDAEHLREELGILLRMRNNPEMAVYRDQLTELIQQIMTLLTQEREAING